jgi:hypothetical protein
MPAGASEVAILQVPPTVDLSKGGSVPNWPKQPPYDLKLAGVGPQDSTILGPVK